MHGLCIYVATDSVCVCCGKVPVNNSDKYFGVFDFYLSGCVGHQKGEK